MKKHLKNFTCAFFKTLVMGKCRRKNFVQNFRVLFAAAGITKVLVLIYLKPWTQTRMELLTLGILKNKTINII